MRVSTVIPVYNRQELVKPAMESALAQSVEGHEIVVIDNCSTDGTWAVVQDYAKRDSRIRCLRNDRNVGPVRNWRLGIEAARGEYCHLLFSDDRLEPDFLVDTLDLFDAKTAYVMTGHTVQGQGGYYGASSFQSKSIISREELLEAAIFLNPSEIQLISPLSTLFRRKDMLETLIDQIPNPFGIDYASHGAGPDQLLFLLIALRYPIVRCVDKRLVVMHAHEGSITIQARDLNLPREWVRWYFVNKHRPEFYDRYRSTLWVKSFVRPVFNSVYEQVVRERGGRVALGFALVYAIRWAFGKARSRGVKGVMKSIRNR
ncbi:MAG: glycosyltransferase [Planctomycetaceae bacterium]|nr:glycosyltransferase [Planctomycetaceae bacterium]